MAKLRIDEEVPFALDEGKLHGFDAATGLNLARAG